MKISFAKYHGTGNDFVLIDNRNKAIHLTTEQISNICHRRFGVGADGLIYILPSDKYDFEMKYFNSDGKEGTMCGNGGRCITGFAHALGIIHKEVRFKAIDGVHKGIIHTAASDRLLIEISLNDVEVDKQPGSYFFINTGSPHYVEFVENIEAVDVHNKGREIRWDKRFQPEGTNVNFVELQKDKLFVKTFERGVEDITLSCGTGVTASALAASLRLNDGRNDYVISTPGGDLKISFKRAENFFHNIRLSGPVVNVFNGTIVI
jgi:diaminopimelate epimerase